MNVQQIWCFVKLQAFGNLSWRHEVLYNYRDYGESAQRLREKTLRLPQPETRPAHCPQLDQKK
eukprot:1136764-Pelagomonas_calceolata.AAC.7